MKARLLCFECRIAAPLRQSLCVALIALLLSPAGADAQTIEVVVKKTGQLVTVDVSTRVSADPQYAWSVLTDFDHMAEFLSAIKSSSVVSRNGTSLEVAQSGEAKRGFLRFSFSTLRAVELLPEHEIRSRLIQGDSFKSFEFVTKVVPAGAGTTIIVHHGEYVPTTWVPPVIGPALIEAETRKQFAELTTEVLRRQALATSRR